MRSAPTVREKIEGAMWGLLVGDALGVPYEFHDPEMLPPREALEMTPPPGFMRAHRGTPVGTWSDDGALALALLDSLLERGKLDADDFGERLKRWYEEGAYAVDARVFDVGVATSRAIRTMMEGTRPALAGETDERSNGNGSLMRVLPLALFHQGDDAALVADAHLQSVVTHGHPRSQACCALYVLWARRVQAEAPDPWGEAVAVLRGLYGEDSVFRQELEQTVRPDDPSPGRGSGYVVDCLRSARWAVAQGDYEAVVKSALALGHDTDTTACVAGGIAGLRDGIGAIPRRFLEAMRGKEIAEPLVARLVARCG
ncbi:ADP-ribosylglycohydrolase family protein [Chondromyces apiculatus]|uniref:ADP-ribosylglycohydrolase family protein n=1 Tax=Chondromyces apiculatus TaxID=51 RepID=UPI0023DDEB79|nr:ADP-ribosylglycohydrolase family protein [Chondromyces apiculatus]